jgi:hypothetical protein
MSTKKETNMFPAHSILRYYPATASDDTHYTAIVLEGESGILQVKGQPGNRVVYPSVLDWMSSLPGSPDDTSMLHVHSKKEEEEKSYAKRQATIKVHKENKKKTSWCVPPQRNTVNAIPWARHIYTMIRECDRNLLQREDMRTAYNHLVEVLTHHSNEIRTSLPYHRVRYETGITMKFEKHGYHGSANITHFVHGMTHVSQERYYTLLDIVIEAYLPLYAMLKDTIVPFMERKVREKRDEMNMKSYRRRRDTYVKKMMRLKARYENECAYLSSQMALYQSYMDHITSKNSK